MIAMYFVRRFSLRSEEESFEEDPRDLFCPALDPRNPNSSTNEQGHELIKTTKILKHSSSGSVIRVNYVLQYIYMF